jgi:hypothetical protein
MLSGIATSINHTWPAAMVFFSIARAVSYRSSRLKALQTMGKSFSSGSGNSSGSSGSSSGVAKGQVGVRSSLIQVCVPASGQNGMSTLFSNDQMLAKGVKGR